MRIAIRPTRRAGRRQRSELRAPGAPFQGPGWDWRLSRYLESPFLRRTTAACICATVERCNCSRSDGSSRAVEVVVRLDLQITDGLVLAFASLHSWPGVMLREALDASSAVESGHLSGLVWLANHLGHRQGEYPGYLGSSPRYEVPGGYRKRGESVQCRKWFVRGTCRMQERVLWNGTSNRSL